MNAVQMRTEVVKAYGSGKQWAYKVSKMPDEKITAIYLSMKKGGKIK